MNQSKTIRFHTPVSDEIDKNKNSRLYPVDQQRVNTFLAKGVNAIEREPFKPIRMMFWLTVIIIMLGLISRLIVLLALPN